MDVREYQRVSSQIQSNTLWVTGLDGGVDTRTFKLNPKQAKALLARRKAIANKYGDSTSNRRPIDVLVREFQQVQDARDQLQAASRATRAMWSQSLDWLVEHGFVVVNHTCPVLTVKGVCCSALMEGQPLVRAWVLHDKHLSTVGIADFVVWLAGFTEPMHRVLSVEASEQLPACGLPDALVKATTDIWNIVHGASYDEQQGGFCMTAACLMRVWVDSRKDVREIAKYTGIHQLGVFVRMVLRVVRFVEEIRPVLLGLQQYELFNALDGHHEYLLAGVVTNLSLYATAV